MDISRLRAIRGAHRGVLTRHINEALAILGDGEQSIQEKERRLHSIKAVIESKKTQLKDMDDKILSQCPMEDIEGEIDEMDRVRMRHIEALQRISEYLTRNGRETRHRDDEGNTSFSSTGRTSGKSKLPKLQLSKFKGDVKTFQTFWGSFDSSGHSNGSVTSIDKFNYLHSLLEGTAAKCIEGLALTEENYGSDVELLKGQFGQPQKIISAHMDDLLKIAPCIGEKPSQLRALFDKASINVRGLESLGVTKEKYESLLIPVVMSKLPNDVRREVARRTAWNVWGMEELMDILRQETEAREVSEDAAVTERKHGFVENKYRGIQLPC